MNRRMMTALLTADAIGNASEGFGPHGLRNPRAHHTIPPITQHTDETTVAANAR